MPCNKKKCSKSSSDSESCESITFSEISSDSSSDMTSCGKCGRCDCNCEASCDNTKDSTGFSYSSHCSSDSSSDSDCTGFSSSFSSAVDSSCSDSYSEPSNNDHTGSDHELYDDKPKDLINKPYPNGWKKYTVHVYFDRSTGKRDTPMFHERTSIYLQVGNGPRIERPLQLNLFNKSYVEFIIHQTPINGVYEHDFVLTNEPVGMKYNRLGKQEHATNLKNAFAPITNGSVVLKVDYNSLPRIFYYQSTKDESIGGLVCIHTMRK